MRGGDPTLRAARLDASLLIAVLTRAATRCSLEDPKRSVEFSRKAIAVATEHSPSDAGRDLVAYCARCGLCGAPRCLDANGLPDYDDLHKGDDPNGGEDEGGVAAPRYGCEVSGPRGGASFLGAGSALLAIEVLRVRRSRPSLGCTGGKLTSQLARRASGASRPCARIPLVLQR